MLPPVRLSKRSPDRSGSPERPAKKVAGGIGAFPVRKASRPQTPAVKKLDLTQQTVLFSHKAQYVASPMAIDQASPPQSPLKSCLKTPAKCPTPKAVSFTPTTHAGLPEPAFLNHLTPDEYKILRSYRSTILAGAVFFLDIRNLDGSEAGQYFIPLIEDLGGIVVDEWSTSEDDITHVVWNLGEPRTLEKVRVLREPVHCVGITFIME
jgi:hypothetical protein